MSTHRAGLWSLLAALALATPADAGEKPVFGPPAPWIIPTSLPPDQPAPTEAAIKIVIEDQQLRLTPQSDDEYVETAIRIQNPQGLQAMGTISAAWNPDLNTITIHKLHIIRGTQIIDVLATGQTFTVLRRETNLEGAALDGTLTAAIQPGGLQIGDIVDFAYTISNVDPVFQGLSEWHLTLDNRNPVTRLRARAQWPGNLPIRWQASAAITGAKQAASGDTQTVTYALDNAEPLPQINGAPARYVNERRIEFTQFASWAALSRHFAPLYAKAEALTPQSTLPAEIARIKAAFTKPQDRAAAALTLVQDQVRYVFLGMNDGGLVPAGADLTWARRFGDCKGKTILLLALLHGMGIEADPVLVKSSGGDGLNTRLPVMSDFDHVLVRARIDDRIYWLDGTRSGDRAIADIPVPAFLWGLPLTESGSDLTPITPQPLSQPLQTEALRIDASAGIYAPAPFHAETIMRGDAARELRMRIANISQSQLDQGLRNYWTRRYGFVDIKSVSAAFDEAQAVERLIMDGTGPVQLAGHGIKTQNLALGAGRPPNFDRPPGPGQDAPFAVPFPSYVRETETILLPNGGAGYTLQGQDVDRIAGGIEYKRSARIDHGSFTGEATARALAPEFPAGQLQATIAALRELAESSVSITLPPHYATSDQDLTAMRDRKLTTADQYLARGNLMMDHGQFDRALPDFDTAITMDPNSARALADRALYYVWKDDETHARQDMAAAAAIDPANPVLLRARGMLALKSGHVRESIASFTRSLDTEPNSVFALQRRAAAYVEAGDDDKAFADATTLMRVQPDSFDPYVIRAGVFRRRGLTDQAAAEAHAVTTLAPANAHAHVAAAKIYAELHRQSDAMREFDRALAIKPSIATYLARANTRDRADAGGKRADIQAALNIDPTDKAALMTRAQLQSDAGDHKGAATTLSTALAAHAKDIELLTRRGIEYVKSNQQALATQDFGAAKALASTADDDNLLCWSKATAGLMLDAALLDCQAALAERPMNANYLDSEAFVLLRLGHYDDAIGIYAKVLELRPVMPTSLFARGIAEHHRGDAKAADRDLAAARSADPGIDQRFAAFGLAP